MTRPETHIPPKPLPPLPLHEKAHIISGFGRGSKELGIPTANVPITELSQQMLNLSEGVYFGWCKVLPFDRNDEARKRIDGTEVVFKYGKELSGNDLSILPYVLSVGWNPFYENKEKAVELHIMHDFAGVDFYGAGLEFNVLGYIRPELNYTTKEALIEDINKDIEIAADALKLDTYAEYKKMLQ